MTTPQIATLLIGIGIATKDRWEDLTMTLRQLKSQGLDRYETIVIDDGSQKPMPAFFREEFPWIRFERSEKSIGVLGKRNRLGRLLSTPLYLSLDDDSFPIVGDLDAAARWLISQPKICALAFPIVFQDTKVIDADLTKSPYPARFFIGCAALLKRDLFNQLGGYEERIWFNGEEPGYCLKAFHQGYETYIYPSVVMRHQVTQQSRNHARRDYYLIRNESLNALWHYPWPAALRRALTCLPAFLIKNPAMRSSWRFLIVGWIEAPYRFLTWPVANHRLSRLQYQEWTRRALPSDPRS